MSDDNSDVVPSTPPRQTNRLNVVLFRKRKLVHEEEIYSESDTCDDEKSFEILVQNRNKKWIKKEKNEQ